MSMKRLAVLAAVQTAQNAHNGTLTSSWSAGGGGGGGGGGGTYVIQGYNMSTNDGGRSGRFETNLHGNVNILLGGAMLSGVVIVVVLVCYCCHRNIRKHQPQEYSQYWRTEPDVHSLEVFTMDSHAMQCYERAGVTMDHEGGMLAPVSRPLTPGPPPAYESLIFNSQHGLAASPHEKKDGQTTPGGDASTPLSVLLDAAAENPAGIAKEEESRRDDEGLPSYEAALKLEANGYV
ncbi:uncharacterized protein s-cup [Neodiprion pinetum]|uniref:Uncharacterized protein LOC107219240 n=1 Tax=Neodiprion lecontei TaxID=441921 RepID=A0A6J0BDC3_NEOLC|nr:uncharacterized protein LOC107219240 [Neodiprion lecontei]XP_046486383.1 uncharacterized protein LOC124220944 [Neodiprion pinetum]XP_046486392.1 uncharacterized protein LOC124220944 [Neodiprion pinetum]XP_046486398.1 uncharacterized protein LOC124220944 [Neodiprion pinetum]XP_046486407.1 uncharacterized protein LOC124220944 [Neodiprion pinetum]XP_046486416.1 uncharacterized protein LOC124220944 [Neodiprion pinetum]XP_046598105.1 uncharacterized protein LOC107219240 [Neodiprion lecontei]XP